MTFVTFSKADDPTKFIDVFLYDMTTPRGAFRVCSVERSSGSKAIATGDGGHRTGADLFFRKGQYYASILTSGPGEEVQKAASSLADALANRLKGKAAELWGLAMLPAKNRIDDTVQYLMVDALGLDFLTFWGTENAEPGGFGPPLNGQSGPGGPVALCVNRQD
jgi:hypothetical protein